MRHLPRATLFALSLTPALPGVSRSAEHDQVTRSVHPVISRTAEEAARVAAVTAPTTDFPRRGRHRARPQRRRCLLPALRQHVVRT